MVITTLHDFGLEYRFPSRILLDPLLNDFLCVIKTEEDQWQTVARTDQGPMREYSVSYQNLMPSSSYTFRVVAYNKFGISYPIYTHDPVRFDFFFKKIGTSFLEQFVCIAVYDAE